MPIHVYASAFLGNTIAYIYLRWISRNIWIIDAKDRIAFCNNIKRIRGLVYESIPHTNIIYFYTDLMYMLYRFLPLYAATI